MSPTSKLRRAVARVAVTVALGLALSACAGGTDEPETGESEAPMPTAEGMTEYPLTLATNYGETVLEERPERIAVIGGNGELDALLAMGVSPVATPWESSDWEWLASYEDQLADATLIDPWADSLNVEALAATEPDLIVAISFGTQDSEFDRLAEVAPVLAIEGDVEPWAHDWKSMTEAVGEHLDLADTAQATIDDTEQYVADGAAQNPQYQDKTLSVVINRGQEAGLQFINHTDSPAEELLSNLGFATHPHAGDFGEGGDFSLENLTMIDADGLLIARHGGTGTVEEATAWLEGNQLYQSLPVVQRDAVGFIDPDEEGTLAVAWAISYPTQLTIPYFVDELNGALDGIYAE